MRKINGGYRLCVFRSNKHIEAQIINDSEGNTVVSASSKNQSLVSKIKPTVTKVKVASIVGKSLAEKAKEQKIEYVVFDRNGFPYHGRIKALADGAREGGLTF